MPDFVKKTNFCFFFPYHDDSGVPVLFYRMANFIASTYPEVQVSAIDYEGGAIARHLLDLNNLKLYIFLDGKEITPPEDSILVMQSDVPYYWPKELKPTSNTKLFFWNLHPRNFIPSLLPFPLLRETPYKSLSIYKLLSYLYPRTLRHLKAYVNLITSHNALAYMDQTNFDYTKKYLFLKTTTSYYLPVPVSINNEIKVNKGYDKTNTLNFCWIGRIADFKIYILCYTCQQLAFFCQKINLKINFYIIGDGPSIKYVKNNIKENEFFKILYIGSLQHNKLAAFLIEQNVHVVTAMGTSALESASLKIPTILLDFSYSKIKINYRFRFLYETVNYDLGHEITSLDEDINRNSLYNILNMLLNKYDDVADLTYSYFRKHHSIDTIVEKFIFLSTSSTLKFGMINKNYFKKTAVLRIYNWIRGLKN